MTVGADTALVEDWSRRLESELPRRGVEPVELRVRVVFERELNSGIERRSNKAAFLLEVLDEILGDPAKGSLAGA